MRHAALRLALILSASLAAVSVSAAGAQAQQAPPVAPAQADPSPLAAPEHWTPVGQDLLGRSAYGLYLSGRMALLRGDQASAARYLGDAHLLEPEQDSLRDQAFVSAMLAGDLTAASRAAPNGPDAPSVLTQAARLIDVTRLLASNKPREALALLDQGAIGAPHARAGRYLRPFVAAAARRPDAFSEPRVARDQSHLFQRMNEAVVLETQRRYADADAQYRRLMAEPAGRVLFRRAYGEFLERRGRRDEAAALYDAALADSPSDGIVQAARERVARRGRPPAAATYAQGAGRALSIAALQSSMEGAHEFAAFYMRLAIQLDPSDEHRLMLAQNLAEAGMEELARSVFVQVGRADPALYTAARAGLAMSFERQERTEEALAELQLAHAVSPQEPQVAYMTAGLLTQLERYDEALIILNGPVLTALSEDFDTRFLRGATYESRGDIPEAEAELWAALELKPDDPMALNYLGYLWVDSGRRVQQGAEMIARAVAADPANGHYQDSLGWAQYRQGLYDEAVVNLEGAVEKLPANAEINDHLGDAYWQVGRQREARFQWTRVLTLDVDAERRADAERKLAEGLAPQTTVATAGAAENVAVAALD